MFNRRKSTSVIIFGSFLTNDIYEILVLLFNRMFATTWSATPFWFTWTTRRTSSISSSSCSKSFSAWHRLEELTKPMFKVPWYTVLFQSQISRLPNDSSLRQILPASGQFHQYFMSSFCAKMLLPKKIQSQNVSREKLRKTLSYKKAHLKCWWNWHQEDIVGSFVQLMRSLVNDLAIFSGQVRRRRCGQCHDARDCARWSSLPATPQRKTWSLSSGNRKMTSNTQF